MRYKIFKFLGGYFSTSSIRWTIRFIDHYFLGLFRRLDEHHLFLGAAGIAFSLLISIIPIILLTFSILGHIISPGSVEQQITTFIETIIPYAEPAAYAKAFILKRIPGVIQYKTLTAYLGAFGLFFTATWLFSSIRTVLNRIYGVSKHRSAWIALLRDFSMVLLLIFLVLISNFILPVLNFLINFADRLEFLSVFRLNDFQDIILSVISILIVFFLFFVFYYLIPYENLGKRVPLLGAFWATILWKIAALVFGYYVSHFLRISQMYGAFILFAIIIFWLFYSSILFVIGAEIGQLYRERKKNYS